MSVNIYAVSTLHDKILKTTLLEKKIMLLLDDAPLKIPEKIVNKSRPCQDQSSRVVAKPIKTHKKRIKTSRVSRLSQLNLLRHFPGELLSSKVSVAGRLLVDGVFQVQIPT